MHPDSTLPRIWFDRAAEMADWVWSHLVARTDVWGGYTVNRDSGEVGQITHPWKSLRGLKPLDKRRVFLHFTGGRTNPDRAFDPSLARRNIVGLHTTSQEHECRSLVIDIDWHVDGVREPGLNWAFALAKYNLLRSLGFRPLLTDSNGAGGYHLRIVFSRAIPSAVAYAFAGWIVADWKAHGLGKIPDLFPRQADLSGRQYGNWIRVPGYHHSRDHWSAAWSDAGWQHGHDCIGHILTITGDSPELIPAEAADFDCQSIKDRPARRPTSAPSASTIGGVSISASDLPSVLDRAAKYIAKLPEAVSGRGGHNATFHAACVLVTEFGLSPADAFPLFRSWNVTHCRPQWSDAELLHKLEDAATEPGERGRLLNAEIPDRPRTTHPEAADLGDITQLRVSGDWQSLVLTMIAAPLWPIAAADCERKQKPPAPTAPSIDDLDASKIADAIAADAADLPAPSSSKIPSRRDPQSACPRMQTFVQLRIDGKGGRVCPYPCDRWDCHACRSTQVKRWQWNFFYRILGGDLQLDQKAFPTMYVFRCPDLSWKSTMARRLREAGARYFRVAHEGMVFATAAPESVVADPATESIPLRDAVSRLSDAVDRTPADWNDKHAVSSSRGWALPKEAKNPTPFYTTVGCGPHGPAAVAEAHAILNRHGLEPAVQRRKSIWSKYILTLKFQFNARHNDRRITDLVNELTSRQVVPSDERDWEGAGDGWQAGFDDWKRRRSSGSDGGGGTATLERPSGGQLEDDAERSWDCDLRRRGD